MRSLNARHMHEDRPTDVLAFPIDFADLQQLAARPAPSARSGPPVQSARSDPIAPMMAGDVVVCPAVAASNAAAARLLDAGRDADAAVTAELELLVVHGLLHLLGHDHAQPAEEMRMQAATDRHLRAWRAAT